MESIQIDGVGLNVTYFKDKTEADFIAEVMPVLPGKFGNDKEKKAWLKSAFILLKKSK